MSPEDAARPTIARAKSMKGREMGGGPSALMRTELLYNGEKILKTMSQRGRLRVAFTSIVMYYLKFGCCSRKKHILK